MGMDNNEKGFTEVMKELFEQRDATKPGSQEEDQAVDRIMEAMFPGNSELSCQRCTDR
jgi:hypothetical protein